MNHSVQHTALRYSVNKEIYPLVEILRCESWGEEEKFLDDWATLDMFDGMLNWLILQSSTQ